VHRLSDVVSCPLRGGVSYLIISVLSRKNFFFQHIACLVLFTPGIQNSAGFFNVLAAGAAISAAGSRSFVDACGTFVAFCQKPVEGAGILVDVYGSFVELYKKFVDIYGIFVDVYKKFVDVYGKFVAFYGIPVDIYKNFIGISNPFVESDSTFIEINPTIIHLN
jgi:hypothetical protein